MFDPRKIREDFPILSRTVHGKPLVYLDNAATTQKPRQVIQSLVDYYEGYNSNVHRAIHTLGEEATACYEEARQKVADFIHAPSFENIIFVRNTTEGINLVAYAWARRHIKAGDEILLTQMEHHSNLIPWQQVAAERGARLRFIPVSPEGTLVLDDLEQLITPRTRLVSIVHVSNVLGTINPVQLLTQAAHERGARILLDGAQSVPHLPVDVQAIGCDFLAFSGHKMLGPTGIGVLYATGEALEEMDPFLRGGEMVRQVLPESATWNDLPFRYEAGTPNIADAIALGAAVDYLKALGMANVREHEKDILAYALNRLRELEEVTIYGPQDLELRSGAISFNLADIHPHDVGTLLDAEGVAIRAGHHCAQPLMRHFNIAATARASFYVYNIREEVDILIQALWKATRFFARDLRRA